VAFSGGAGTLAGHPAPDYDIGLPVKCCRDRGWAARESGTSSETGRITGARRRAGRLGQWDRPSAFGLDDAV
jgi:hypothetical protein